MDGLDGLASGVGLIALATFLIGYIQNRNAERRRQTLDFLLTINNEEGPVHRSAMKMSALISSGIELEDDNVDKETDRVLIELLDFYDLVADSALRRIVDREMIITHLGGRMRSAYIITEKYIKARRERLDRPGLYRPFEDFVLNYVCDRDV